MGSLVRGALQIQKSTSVMVTSTCLKNLATPRDPRRVQDYEVGQSEYPRVPDRQLPLRDCRETWTTSDALISRERIISVLLFPSLRSDGPLATSRRAEAEPTSE